MFLFTLAVDVGNARSQTNRIVSGEEFVHKALRDEHENTEHSGTSRFKCDTCHRVFKEAWKLKVSVVAQQLHVPVLFWLSATVFVVAGCDTRVKCKSRLCRIGRG